MGRLRLSGYPGQTHRQIDRQIESRRVYVTRVPFIDPIQKLSVCRNRRRLVLDNQASIISSEAVLSQVQLKAGKSNKSLMAERSVRKDRGAIHDDQSSSSSRTLDLTMISCWTLAGITS